MKQINELNSDLQSLKTELDKINCSFADYQSTNSQLPMLPIGMKDTIPIDFKPFFLRFLEDHYYADSAEYDILSPLRNETGIKDHKRYYSLLTIVDHRFFSKEIKRDLFFTWNDSFTGVAFKQVSLAFEKGSVLFNLGALYSQLATACLQAQECKFIEFAMNPHGDNENHERLGLYIGLAIAVSYPLSATFIALLIKILIHSRFILSAHWFCRNDEF
ncbi:hypothetical protein Ciccas_010284 [Cichlidogyrus casuarinus]|uniref:BRO1 domain-containing protein n=1 Tax=Cichlidogyrus casuarinus TaxID=1844966 RepID=A0ABD2PUJ5_9PLAT